MSVADDLRYNLWTMLAAALAWMIALLDTDWEVMSRTRRWLALAPPGLVAATTLAAQLA